MQPDYNGVMNTFVEPDSSIAAFDRMVVGVEAQEVGSGEGRPHLSLFGATLMPRQAGMFGLVTMLFAPAVKLQFAKPREGGGSVGTSTEHLIGCIAGLGANRDGVSLYTEHDVRVAFDCRFDNEDMEAVRERT